MQWGLLTSSLCQLQLREGDLSYQKLEPLQSPDYCLLFYIWQEEDGLMLKEENVYVLKNKALRVEVIRLHYDTPMGEHGGQWKTVELVTGNFWWPGVNREVKRHVEGCNACQQNKNCTEQPAGKLMPNSIPDKAWSHILADFITKLLLTQGYNSILVVIDCFTKIVHFVSTMEKTTAEGLAMLCP